AQFPSGHSSHQGAAPARALLHHTLVEQDSFSLFNISIINITITAAPLDAANVSALRHCGIDAIRRRQQHQIPPVKGRGMDWKLR
ncbi:hypothetical protein E4U49_008173, partial [Claviceps purpurea]